MTAPARPCRKGSTIGRAGAACRSRGMVSAGTISFQFGTDWPGYMEWVGNIVGPPLAYEVLTASFLEAGFLGVMPFGHGKVSAKVHLMAT